MTHLIAAGAAVTLTLLAAACFLTDPQPKATAEMVDAGIRSAAIFLTRQDNEHVFRQPN